MAAGAVMLCLNIYNPHTLFSGFCAVFSLGMRDVSSRLGRTCSVRPGRQELQPECCGAGVVDLAGDALYNTAVNLNTCGHTRLAGKPDTYTFIHFFASVYSSKRSELSPPVCFQELLYLTNSPYL